MRADHRRIEKARLIAGRTIVGQLREAVAAVARRRARPGWPQSAAIADVGVVDALAVRVLLALGKGGVEVERQVVGGVELQIEADLIGLTQLGREAGVQIHRRAGLTKSTTVPFVVHLHVAQIVQSEPQREAVRFGDELLARIVVIEGEQQAIRRAPLEGDAAVDALIVRLRLLGAVLLLPPTHDALVSDLGSGASGRQLTGREATAHPT